MENQSNLDKSVKPHFDDDQKWSDDSDILDIVFESAVSNNKSPEKTVLTASKSSEKNVSTDTKRQEKIIPDQGQENIVLTAVKSQTPTDDDIECICLDDSDSDNIEVSFSTSPSKKDATPSVTEEPPKKIDYLNLESSDTDEEQEKIQNDVNNLLSSAAILNDIECGPTKPMPVLDVSISLPSCSNVEVSPSKKRSNSPSAPVVNKDTDCDNVSPIDISVDKISSDLSNKKIKSDPLTTDAISSTIIQQNVSVSTPEPQSLLGMYRKDEKIIAAYKRKGTSCIPSTISQRINAHDKVISSLTWCAIPYSHLFLSASLDSTVKVWDIYCENNKPIHILNVPSGVRAAKWTKSGEQILAGGFGGKLHVVDALSGKSIMVYNVHSHISCIEIHPYIEDVILCGTNNSILGFDLRVCGELPVRTFHSNFGEVLDIAFLNKNEFACSTSIVSHDSADRTIMVWDFNSGAIMSNQIYLERYTCPSLKSMPSGSSFIAQSNGNYIAEFSSQRPYKIKNKRYTGHKVSGFGIQCEISPDGRYVASGDSDGDVYFYNYGDTTMANKLNIKSDVATNRLQWHPILSSTMVVATWDGQVHVCK